MSVCWIASREKIRQQPRLTKTRIARLKLKTTDRRRKVQRDKCAGRSRISFFQERKNSRFRALRGAAVLPSEYSPNTDFVYDLDRSRNGSPAEIRRCYRYNLPQRPLRQGFREARTFFLGEKPCRGTCAGHRRGRLLHCVATARTLSLSLSPSRINFPR